MAADEGAGEACGTAISYEGAVDLLLSNKFAEAEETFSKDIDASTRHALLFAQVSFARAVLSLAPKDAEEAMERCWEANRRATAVLKGGMSLMESWMGGGGAEISAAEKIDQTLVSADAHMMGAMMQLVLGSYVKGAWNIKTAWSLYAAAFQTREREPDTVPDALKCIIDFGVGMFNLVVSLLPATYLTLAQLVGFSGDRNEAFRLLNRSCQSGQYWSPFACLLLLYFYTQLAPNLGICKEEHAATVEGLLCLDVATKRPDACLFLWMRGGAARLTGKHADAADLLVRAEDVSRDMPALQAMILNDIVWVHFSSLNFRGAADTLTSILKSSKPVPYHAVYAYEAGIALLCESEEEEQAARDILSSVGDWLEGEESEVSQLGAEKYALAMSRYLLSMEKIDRKEGLSAYLELLVLWDDHRRMTREHAGEAWKLFEASSLLPDDKDAPVSARRGLIGGALKLAQGETAEGRKMLEGVLMLSDEELLGSMPGGGDGRVYRAYAKYVLGTLLKESDGSADARTVFEMAMAEKAHHLQTPLSFKLHAALSDKPTEQQ